MKIIDAICSKGMTGFYFDDQLAIKNGATKDGEIYKGATMTNGFTSIRQAGESISIMLVLDSGEFAYGDCCAVQYSGAGGRYPLFLADKYIKEIREYVFPKLIGQKITSFKNMAKLIDNINHPITNKKLHTAIRYGISQAVLHAVSLDKKMMMTEVIANEYGTSISSSEIPIFTQSGDLRYENADKMILKKASVLPHGLINNIPDKLGYKGEKLLEYITWLTSRIKEVGGENYKPTLHIDVYGTIGTLFKNDIDEMIRYLEMLKKASKDLTLRIEGPIDMKERSAQVGALAALTDKVNYNIQGLEIVADEWCNTLEDIKYFADNKAGHMLQIKTPDLGSIHNIIDATLYCKEKNIGAYQGGSCNETDRSARVCVHVAMATSPDMMLAKPGMGVDEGYMIVYNEMQRILALSRRHK